MKKRTLKLGLSKETLRAMDPAAPPFLAPLSVRLTFGREFLLSSEKKELLEHEVAPELREKILKSRPEWLKD